MREMREEEGVRRVCCTSEGGCVLFLKNFF